jgi:hypothetical protein
MTTVIWTEQESSADDEIYAAGATITSQLYKYCKTLKLRKPIQNKRRGMLTYGVLLLNVNVRLHTDVRTRALIVYFNLSRMTTLLRALI